jgi:beta-mannosidase
VEEKKATLEVVSFDLDAAKIVDTQTTEVTLAPNASTEFWKGNVAGQPTRTSAAQIPKIIVVGARLIDHDGTVLARYGVLTRRLPG